MASPKRRGSRSTSRLLRHRRLHYRAVASSSAGSLLERMTPAPVAPSSYERATGNDTADVLERPIKLVSSFTKGRPSGWTSARNRACCLDRVVLEMRLHPPEPARGRTCGRARSRLARLGVMLHGLSSSGWPPARVSEARELVVGRRSLRPGGASEWALRGAGRRESQSTRQRSNDDDSGTRSSPSIEPG